MSRLGRVFFREQGGLPFLPGATFGSGEREYSEQTAREIDMELRKILSDATEEVRAILQGRRASLEAVALRLVEKEVIDGSELRQILELHSPGPKLVPGSLAVPVAPEPPAIEHLPEGGVSASAGAT